MAEQISKNINIDFIEPDDNAEATTMIYDWSELNVIVLTQTEALQLAHAIINEYRKY